MAMVKNSMLYNQSYVDGNFEAVTITLHLIYHAVSYSGFPQKLDSENGHGNVMEHEKLAKSHGIL